MAEENKVQKVGRVEYIEPNSLFTYSQDDVIQNGIPQPYEDYCFSVNLRVINGNRYDCGMTAEGDDMANNTLEFSSDRGTLSFMDGTSVNGGQGYWTTNFTDISMNDPSTNTKECIGIESINVKFSSWYTPTVDIKFVDVRGASLMQPAEYNYYNTGGPTPGKNDSTAIHSDFFKAFFSFPYPLFKLSIKGFYGKEVTFDLSVLKANVEFNSQTGNFEVNASFIGYMYGLYSDLPFPLIYIAPYIELYGKETWIEKKGNGDFCYLTDNGDGLGIGMYTFPELRIAVQEASQNVDKQISNSPEGKKMDELNKLRKFIGEEVHSNYPASTRNFTWWSWSKTGTKENNEGFLFMAVKDSPQTNRAIFGDFYKFSSALTTYNELVAKTEQCKEFGILPEDIFSHVFDNASGINHTVQANSSAETVTSKFTDDDIKNILGNDFATLFFHKDETNKDKPTLVYDSAKSVFGGNYSESDFLDLINMLKERFVEKDQKTPMVYNSSEKEWIIKAFKMKDIDYKNKIVDTLNDISSQYNELKTNLDEKRKQDIVQAIGFKPTIKNLYNMIFAHIDTFMSAFYNTLDRIRKSIQSSSDKSRSKETLCGGGILVDVNENTLKSSAGHDGKLPPFTMFYKEQTVKDTDDKEIVMLWPGDLNGGKELDEVKLVEAIINATALNKISSVPVSPKDNVNKLEGDLVPTNYYDLARNEGNPYLDVLSDELLSDPNTLQNVINVFIFRCYYALLNGSYITPDKGQNTNGSSTETQNYTDKAKLIAELEVRNVERAFQMLGMKPKDEFINRLMSQTSNGSDVISSFLGGQNPILVSTPNGLAYRWIKKSSMYLYPVGVFTNKVLNSVARGANAGKEQGKFILLDEDGSVGATKTGNSCRIYANGGRIEDILKKHATGDFQKATKLFPSYKQGALHRPGTGNPYYKRSSNGGDISSSLKQIMPSVPSYRITEAGTTSVFMDPLYYAQDNPASRAYLFLMGLSISTDRKYFLPEKVSNGDSYALVLLREGAAYWRNYLLEGGALIDDPIKYNYVINGVSYEVLQDIEKNDPVFGKSYVLPGSDKLPKNVSFARKKTLMRYFLRWAYGNENYPVPPGIVAEVGEVTEIPTPAIDFQSLERTLGLWGYETVGTINGVTSQVKKFLDGKPEEALAYETADSYANKEELKAIYNVSYDGKLGKLSGGIRTVVEINLISTGGTDSTNTRKTLSDIARLMDERVTVIDYSCFDNPNASCTVPRTAMNDAVSAFVDGLKEAYNVSVEQLKKATGTTSTGGAEDTFKKAEQFKGHDLKLACYMVLKNLYDRWLCSLRRERWHFSCRPENARKNGIRSDFERFFYINEFYQNIGMTVKPNVTRFIEYASKEGAFTEKTNEFDLTAKSVLNLLSTTAQYGGCALLTLPTQLGLATTYSEPRSTIADVFKAFTYNEAVKMDGIETSFIVLYSNQKSSSLDNNDSSGKYAYTTDGFDIADTWGKIVPQPMFADSDAKGYVVPCFGVTFAKQNQSYFKNVRLSMEDHQVTDYSLKNMLMISYGNNMGSRETTLLGQDLYSVYANYSYACTVEMMGDAQITPLMYFQLNNIAMWKGAYLITEVSHNITSQGMTTIFKGVRQARPSVPMKSDETDQAAADVANQTNQSQNEEPGKAQGEAEKATERQLDKIDVDKATSIVFILTRTASAPVEDTERRWVTGMLDVRVYYDNGEVVDYSNAALTIEVVNGLTARIEELPEVITNLPLGRYNDFSLKNSNANNEYRSSNDSFYSFTDGKHILVTDSALGNKASEIITGETDYKEFESGGFAKISLGGMSPIMIYSDKGPDIEKQIDPDEIRATYKEIFDLVRRANEAKKPLSMLVTNNSSINMAFIENDEE